jgi:hypothetical protein
MLEILLALLCAPLFRMVANWRATADEDGHYCFAVALGFTRRNADSIS